MNLIIECQVLTNYSFFTCRWRSLTRLKPMLIIKPFFSPFTIKQVGGYVSPSRLSIFLIHLSALKRKQLCVWKACYTFPKTSFWSQVFPTGLQNSSQEHLYLLFCKCHYNVSIILRCIEWFPVNLTRPAYLKCTVLFVPKMHRPIPTWLKLILSI